MTDGINQPPSAQPQPEPFRRPQQPYGHQQAPGQPPLQAYGLQPPPGYPPSPPGYQHPPGYYPPAGYQQPYPNRPLPYGVVLASPWLRLGAALLNALLAVVTLIIGWLVWAIVLWLQGTGQNPGKKLVGIRVVSAETGAPAGPGLFFVRNFVLGGIVMSLLSMVTLGILPLVDQLMIFSDRNRRLIDRWAGTLVAHVPR